MLALLLALPAFVQDPSLVEGAYRGPFDEVLTDSADAAELGADVNALDTWDRWEFWFAFEREALARGRVEQHPARLTRASRYGREPWHLTRASVLDKAVPWLEKALKSRHPEIREAAALSLGRIGHSGSAPALARTLRDGSPEVRQAGMLALGWLGEGRPLVELVEYFLDTDHPAQERAFAAIGLGLSGRGEAVEVLGQYLERHLSPVHLVSSEETAIQGAVFGATLLRSDHLVPALITGYERLERTDTASTRRVRTLLLQALGHTGHGEAFPVLRRSLRDGDPAIQRAAAQGLGWLGDTRAYPILARAVKEGGDAETVQFSLIAMGRLGGAESEKWLQEVWEHVQLDRQYQACWYLAAGLADEVGLESQIESGFTTRLSRGPQDTEYTRRDEQRLRGAQAIGLGLAGDPRFTESLAEVMFETGTGFDLAGYAAMALGMLQHEEAFTALVQAHGSESGQPDFRRGLQWGLGWSGRPEAANLLVQTLIREDQAETRWAAAHALGLVRSQAAFDALFAALTNTGELQRPVRHSAHLVLALGHLADRRSGDGLATLLSGLNYRQEFALLRTLASY